MIKVHVRYCAPNSHELENVLFFWNFYVIAEYYRRRNVAYLVEFITVVERYVLCGSNLFRRLIGVDVFQKLTLQGFTCCMRSY